MKYVFTNEINYYWTVKQSLTHPRPNFKGSKAETIN